jgi:hypothetical protein
MKKANESIYHQIMRNWQISSPNQNFSHDQLLLNVPAKEVLTAKPNAAVD